MTLNKFHILLYEQKFSNGQKLKQSLLFLFVIFWMTVKILQEIFTMPSWFNQLFLGGVNLRIEANHYWQITKQFRLFVYIKFSFISRPFQVCLIKRKNDTLVPFFLFRTHKCLKLESHLTATVLVGYGEGYSTAY